MKNLDKHIDKYLYFCETQKNLNSKTLKAYKIDLYQFSKFACDRDDEILLRRLISDYIAHMHPIYQPKTVKRKIASLKAFIHYLVMEDILVENPFQKITLNYREPRKLPKTIPASTIQVFLDAIYKAQNQAGSPYQKRTILRDIAVIELLFATGMRISELCSLKVSDLNLKEKRVLIFGKGAKERMLHIGNVDVISALDSYLDAYSDKLKDTGSLFINRRHQRLSEQSVRNLINKYAELAGIQLHITPHMFRHSFATLLLESDVDIRYIQKFLGHSSITTTEIYTQVSMHKQEEILETRHPRNKMEVDRG